MILDLLPKVAQELLIFFKESDIANGDECAK